MSTEASTIAFGVKSNTALTELVKLSTGLTGLKEALMAFNRGKAGTPFDGMSAASKTEFDAVKRQMTELKQTHAVQLAEMQAQRDAAMVTAERKSKEHQRKLIEQNRQYQLYTSTGSGNAGQNLPLFQQAATLAAIEKRAMAEQVAQGAAIVAVEKRALAEQVAQGSAIAAIQKRTTAEQVAQGAAIVAVEKRALAEQVAQGAAIAAIHKRTRAEQEALGASILAIQRRADAEKKANRDLLLQRDAANMGPPTSLFTAAHAKATHEATRLVHEHNEAQKLLHSTARGLSGALGVLWLTYGAYVPAMIAGFATMATLKKIVTSGVEFDYTTSFTAALEDRGGPAKSQAYKEKLQEDIREVAKTTQYSANELAKGLRVLEQTGVDAASGIGLIRTAAQAALMGEVDMKTATEDLVAVMQVFKLRSEDPLTMQKNFQRVGDVMATVAKETQANLHDVAESLKQVTGLSGQYQVKLETTAAIITQLGKAGIVGSRAGTFTRNMFENLYAQGTAEAQKIKSALGITPFAADGSYKKDIDFLTETFGKLRAINSEKERGIAISAIFNERGGKPARELLTAFEGVAAALSKVNNSQGSLQRFAESLQGVAKIEWQTVASRWDDLLGKAFKGSEKSLADMAKQLQSAFNDGSVQSGLQSIFQTTVLIARTVALIAQGWAQIAKLGGSTMDSSTMKFVLSMRGLAGVDGDLSKRSASGKIGVDSTLKAIEADAAKQAASRAGKVGGTNLPLSITNPDAFKEQQRLARLSGDAAAKEFRAREVMAQQYYKFSADLTDSAYAKGLLTDEAYQAARKQTEELYLFDIASAEFEASRKMASAKSKLEKESIREQLDIAMSGIHAQMSAKESAHQLERAKRLEEAKQDALKYANQVTSKDAPALAAKASFDTDKLWRGRNADLISPTEKAELEATLRVETQFDSAINSLNDRIAEQVKLHGENTEAVRALSAAKVELLTLMGVQVDRAKLVAAAIVAEHSSMAYGADQAFAAYANSATNAAENARGAFERAFKGMEDALVSFVRTGKLDFKSLANSIIEDMIRIQIREKITGPLAKQGMSFLGNLFGSGGGASAAAAETTAMSAWAALPMANGGLFKSPDLSRYSNTIVSSPTLFKFAQGGAFRSGLMGEAGDEAIMPLARDSSGKLGVRASSGGGATSVRIELVNQGTPQQAVSANASFDAEGMIIKVVTRDIANDGPISNIMRDKFGTNRAVGAY